MLFFETQASVSPVACRDCAMGCGPQVWKALSRSCPLQVVVAPLRWAPSRSVKSRSGPREISPQQGPREGGQGDPMQARRRKIGHRAWAERPIFSVSALRRRAARARRRRSIAISSQRVFQHFAPSPKWSSLANREGQGACKPLTASAVPLGERGVRPSVRASSVSQGPDTGGGGLLTYANVSGLLTDRTGISGEARW